MEERIIKPLSPNDVQEEFNKTIPQFIIEAVNKLIVKNWNGDESVVKQNEILDLVCHNEGPSRQEVFGNHWLDVEDLYRKAGWSVEYDKPAYNETYDAYFKFKKKK